ncbi:YesL family protein [Neobacillus sp. 179-J 1A1 HS]|uniref:YesL family protein n=1 Tax=Neobacillus driksii TaxID=3035913 RepID=UPI0035BC1C16
MQMNGAIGGFYRLCDWIMKLAYINILWISFSLLGLIVFGLFPATTAMFVIVRKILMDKDEIPILKTFWESYKSEFFKSNLLGLILTITGYILYIDIFFLRNTTGFINLLYYPSLMLALGFVLTLFYVFPTLVHFDLSILQVIKCAFVIMLMNPLSTVLMVIGSFAAYLLMTTIPGLIPIFSGSILSFVIMWASFIAFSRIKKLQNAS